MRSLGRNATIATSSPRLVRRARASVFHGRVLSSTRLASQRQSLGPAIVRSLTMSGLPHDALFKTVFSDPVNAEAELRATHADLLFRARFVDGEALGYVFFEHVLFEHQSSEVTHAARRRVLDLENRRNRKQRSSFCGDLPRTAIRE